MVHYKPWRRRIDRRRMHLILAAEYPAIDEDTVVSDGEVIAVPTSSGVDEVEAVKVAMDEKK